MGGFEEAVVARLARRTAKATTRLREHGVNARQARKAAATALLGAVEVVGQPAGAEMPRRPNVERGAARSSRMWPKRLEPLLPGIVAVLLAQSVVAAQAGGTAGFFGAAILVLAGPALGGLAVCAVMLGSRWAASKAPWIIDQMAFRHSSSRPKVFARADIASVLVPLVDHAGLQGRGTIQIVGSDGGYLTGAKKTGLTDAIRKWIAEGYNFRYILVAPRKEAVAELETLKEQIARQDDTAHARFEVLRLGGGSSNASAGPTSTPVDIQRLARLLRTCHPTLIWSEDGARKAMWIEGNHPAGEDVSYNNQWAPPAAMRQAVADLQNQTWADVFAAWDGKLRRLCEYSREQMAIQ